MKKRFTLSFLLLTFVAQAQVIPVGFIKSPAPRVFVNTPTGDPNPPITTNLLLYLDATRTASYDGTSTTTWKDISGQSNHATLAGSANPYTPAPIFGSGNLLNGSGSFAFAAYKNGLTSNLISSLSAATFIVWVNPTDSQTQNQYAGIIFSRAGNAQATSQATGLNFNNNNAVGYHWADGQYSWYSNLLVPKDSWSMIAISISSDKAVAYLCKSNSISSATNTAAHGAISGLNFFIGCDPYDKNNRAFIGKIATSMVYSTALTEANITAIFNAQKVAFGL